MNFNLFSDSLSPRDRARVRNTCQIDEHATSVVRVGHRTIQCVKCGVMGFLIADPDEHTLFPPIKKELADPDLYGPSPAPVGPSAWVNTLNEIMFAPSPILQTLNVTGLHGAVDGGAAITLPIQTTQE